MLSRSYSVSRLGRLLLLLMVGVAVLFVFMVGTASSRQGETAVSGTLNLAAYSQPNQNEIISTISIVSVVAGESVTIQTHNFPAKQTFEVRMGAMFTQGIGGIVVGSFDSGTGGTMEKTFAIPEAFKDDYRVAIRTQTAHAYQPYYSYNWFYNVVPVAETAVPTPTTTAEPSTSPTPAPVLYTGIPTFTVCSVARDSKITIVTNNMPPNQIFVATMGAFGTAGIGGTQVATIDSEQGGALNIVLNVPAHLHGSHQIAVRLQTTHAVAPFHAYNWFYNYDATVC